jgi:hypothetical protein
MAERRRRRRTGRVTIRRRIRRTRTPGVTRPRVL